MIQPQLLPRLLFVLGFFSALAPRPHATGQAQQEGQQEGQKRYVPAVKLPDDFVRFARLPDEGTKPCVELDGAGGLAILYYKGSETAGDLYLTRSKDEAKTFEPSLRLNAQPGTVMAQDAGHSGALAVGPDGRAHVAWVENGGKPTLHYAEQKPGAALESAQDLGSPEGLCASSAIAVDAQGKIHVFFAAQDAPAAEAVEGEKLGLRIWVRSSSDGVSFGEPIAIDQKADGVCASSAYMARVDSGSGVIYLCYVTAGRRGGPEVRVLASSDGVAFSSRTIELPSRRDMPRASPKLSQERITERTIGKPQIIACWDTYGQVFWGALDPRTSKLQGGLPIQPRKEKLRRARAAGLASGSEYLLAWIEQPVGDRSAPAVVSWQVWYQDGLTPLGWGHAPEPAGSSTPAVFANKMRGFTILY